jgi:hypothetical protein
MRNMILRACFLQAAPLVTAAALHAAVPEPNLVFTQVPLSAPPAGATSRDLLDVRYPEGSRVVMVKPPSLPDRIVVLSGRLCAAGNPILAWDSKRVLFVGKEQAGSPWQIFDANPGGGTPRQLTHMPGGAMAPSLLSSGELVFISPVPGLNANAGMGPRSAIYVKPAHGPERRLTFGAADVTDLTALADGRILFVTALQTEPPISGSPHSQALFTVNNDGTEFALYAGQHERPLLVLRPREVGNRLAYLASDPKSKPGATWPEAVRSARPFSHHERLFPFAAGRCRSLDDGGQGTCLASLEKAPGAGAPARGSFAIFRLNTNSTALGEALFDDPAWDDIEASLLTKQARPMGHISVMSPTKRTGSILCLDANCTSDQPANEEARKAAAVRISALADNGCTNYLGTVALSADGSFVAEVPADLPLGFETLDSQGRVLRGTPPVVWVRPGENRSCVGCHEPHGRSPRNHRPLAVRSPTPHLSEAPARVGRKPALP